MRVLALLLLYWGVLNGSPSWAQDAPLTAEQEQRYSALNQELRCLVCQNQNIADSTAPLAADLRDQVKAQILAGKTNVEITDYLIARYGDFVLYRPRLKATTALLWGAPLLLVPIGLLLALRQRRRRSATLPPPKADPEALKRLLDDAL
jgi:cytochrome c-type biogenesis protein CcmH